MITKANIIDEVAAKTGLKKKDADAAVAAVIEAITAGLKSEGKVQLFGFGTFEVKERAARTGRNPQTGETIEIKASKNVGFKAVKGLKDALN